MSAIHQFSESNGAGEVETIPISSLNFGSNDSANLNPTQYPILRSNASFEKYLRCKFTDTFTEISNMKFWLDYSELYAEVAIKAAANEAYVEPSDAPNGDSDIPTDEGSALAIQASDGSDTIVAPGYTKYIRLQLQTTIDASAGFLENEFIFQYDEV